MFSGPAGLPFLAGAQGGGKLRNSFVLENPETWILRKLFIIKVLFSC
jgi:hypothetical protein